MTVRAGNNTLSTLLRPTAGTAEARPWLLIAVILGILLAVPLVTVVAKVFTPGTPAWEHIAQNLLWEYTVNSVFLCLTTGAITLTIGVGCAWLVSRFRFPGRGWLEWALILPLALPSYIVAYSYAGILSFTGPLYTLIGRLGGREAAKALYFDSMNIFTLAVTLGLVLFPYVYLPAKAAFQLQSASMFEAASSLSGKSGMIFRRVALPLARPAIAGGLFLVLMEVLNDYGAVYYFGVSTFTTGIFKAWFSMGDLEAAIRLSAVLMLAVGLLFIAEKYKQRSRFASNTGLNKSRPEPVKGRKKWLYTLICILPVLLGFALPFLKISVDAAVTWGKVSGPQFYMVIANSVLLAGGAAVLIVVLSVFFIYSSRINRSVIAKGVNRVVALGYALPGAVIAVGVMVVGAGLERFTEGIGLTSGSILVTGSVAGLIYAYTIRFMAVSVNPLEGNFKQQCAKPDEAARSLGKGYLFTLFRVNIPVMRPAILSAFLLVFLDVMKELPLTLILRPFNFDTLATTAFAYANDEMLRESAPASLLIVSAGIVPVLLIHKSIKSL